MNCTLFVFECAMCIDSNDLRNPKWMFDDIVTVDDGLILSWAIDDGSFSLSAPLTLLTRLFPKLNTLMWCQRQYDNQHTCLFANYVRIRIRPNKTLLSSDAFNSISIGDTVWRSFNLFIVLFFKSFCTCSFFTYDAAQPSQYDLFLDKPSH